MKGGEKTHRIKTRTLLLLFLAIMNSGTHAFSQIKGVVSDKENKPVEFANVALFALPDTTQPILGAVTDSTGFYRISGNIPPGSYQLRASFLSYKTANATLQIKSDKAETEQNFTLQTDETRLNEVVIEGQRPAMKVEGGKLTYHIPSLLKNKPITNAYDALKDIPGVMEQNDKITLLGANGTTILLNGKKTSMTYDQLMTLLRSIPLSNVEDVEIMYSVPPNYNIRGAAINVTLKKQTADNARDLWQGEVAADYIQKTNANARGRANILYQGKNTSVDALYSYGNYKGHSEEDLTAEHTLNGIVYHIDQHSEGSSKQNKHNARVALQQAFKNKDKVDLSYTGIFDDTSSNRTASTDVSGTTTNTRTVSKGPSSMHNMKIDYAAHFGLNIGADYTLYDDKSNYSMQNSLAHSSAPTGELSYRSKQEIHRTMLYANQFHQLKNSWSVNYGFNFSNAQTKNRSDAIKDGSEFEDATFYTQQREQIWNIFAGFSKTFSKKLSVQASIATELYKATETSKGTKTTLWDNVAWFPTFNMSYNLSPDHTFQFAVSSDKTYPSYWSLNPNVYYFSSYGVTYGNPHLRPMRNYNVGLTYIFKRKYVIRPYINHIPDYFTQLPYQSRDKLQQEFMQQNYNYKQNIGLLSVIPFNIGKRISSRFVANAIYSHEKDDEFFDLSFDRKTVMGIFQMNHDISLSAKPNLKMNVAGYFVTPTGIQGIYDLGASGNLSGGLTWTFDKSRAKLILKADDILNTRIPKATIDYKGQKSTLDTFQDTRTISLSFVYSFGGYKESKRKDVDNSRFGTN